MSKPICHALPPKAVVLGGGGLSCIAFTGALRHLEEQYPTCMQGVELFVGCSAGALLAFLFTMGMPPLTARDWCYVRILGLSANELDLEGAFELATRLGIDDGSRMTALIAEALNLWDMTEATTFAELATLTRRELVVCVANVTRGRRQFLSGRTSPDIPVALALRMSMAVPLLYTPVHYRDAVYVDGGIVDNCPVSFWFTRMAERDKVTDENDTEMDRERAVGSAEPFPVLVLDLVSPPGDRRNATTTLPSLWHFIISVFNTTIGSALHRVRRCRARIASHGDLTYVPIQSRTDYPFFSTRSLSFQMNHASVEALDMAGYDAMGQHM